MNWKKELPFLKEKLVKKAKKEKELWILEKRVELLFGRGECSRLSISESAFGDVNLFSSDLSVNVNVNALCLSVFLFSQ